MEYRKEIIKAFVWILSIFLLFINTSCGDNDQDKKANTVQTAKKLKIAINAGPEGKAIEILGPKYEEAELEIIKLPYQSLRQQLISALNDEQTDFDIVMVDDPWFPQLAENLAQLNNIPSKLMDDIVPSSLALCRSPYKEGDLKALPFVGNTQLLFYRADILSKLGYENVPTQWQELSGLAKEISDGSLNVDKKRVYGYAIRGRSGAPIVTDFLPVFWSMGGRLVNDRGNPTAVAIDKKKLKKAMLIYKELQESSPPGATNFDWSEMTAAFTNGQAVFELNWPAAIPKIDSAIKSKKKYRKWGLSLPPGNQGNTGTSMIGNWLLAIPRDSEKIELAEELIIWLMEQQGKVASSGNPPTRQSVFKQLAEEPGKEYFSTILKALKLSTPRARTEKWTQIEDAVSRSVSGFLTGGLTIDKAVKMMESEINKIF